MVRRKQGCRFEARDDDVAEATKLRCYTTHVKWWWWDKMGGNERKKVLSCCCSKIS